MAKYVLVGIAAKYVHSNLGVRVLEASLGENHPYDLIRREFTINQQIEDIYGALLKEEPEVLLFSVYIWNREHCDRLSRRLKRALPDIRIFYGGPEASYQAREILIDLPEVEGVFVGEGEEAFRCFLEDYEKNIFDPLRIPSLVYRHEGGIRKNLRPEFLSMKELPIGYAEDFSDVEHQIFYYESSRGCPYGCAYCLSSLDHVLRERPLEQVLADVDRFIEAELPQVKFIDRTFNAKPERALAIWTHIVEQDRGISNFHFEVTADILTDQALELISQVRPGLFQFEIGVQSTHPPTLKAVHRQMDMKRLAQVVQRLNQNKNIHLHLDLIAGLPYEDLPTFAQSFNEVFALEPQDLQLGFLKLLPGTELHARAREYEIFYEPDPPYEVLRTRWLSPEDLQSLKEIERVLGIYHNSGRFQRSLALYLKSQRDPFTGFERLAEVFGAAGLFGQKIGLKQETEVLRQAFLESEQSREAEFIDALVYDLYARNRPRRLPAWIPDYSIKEGELVRLLEAPSMQVRLQAAGIMEDPSRLARKHLGAFWPKSGEAYYFYYDRRDISGNALVFPLSLS